MLSVAAWYSSHIPSRSQASSPIAAAFVAALVREPEVADHSRAAVTHRLDVIGSPQLPQSDWQSADLAHAPISGEHFRPCLLRDLLAEGHGLGGVRGSVRCSCSLLLLGFSSSKFLCIAAPAAFRATLVAAALVELFSGHRPSAVDCISRSASAVDCSQRRTKAR